jgi:hypothetical protein
MAKIGFNYEGDAEELNSNDFDRTPLPEGKYIVEILDSDYRDTKTGNGSYVMVEFGVLDPQFTGRKLWANYNIVHSNEKAQEIGQQQFAKLCLAALGKPSCTDTDELIGRQVALGVGFEKNDPSRNRVKWSEPVQQTTSAPAPRVAAPAPAPAAAAPRKNAWQKPQ